MKIMRLIGMLNDIVIHRISNKGIDPNKIEVDFELVEQAENQWNKTCLELCNVSFNTVQRQCTYEQYSPRDTYLGYKRNDKIISTRPTESKIVFILNRRNEE